MTPNQIENFLVKIELIPFSTCWWWTGSRQSNGYGNFTVGSKKNRSNMKKLAHRLSYEYFVGIIPTDLHIDHLCRNRLCVNPKHLEPVTPRVNALRGSGFGGVNSRKTHCLRGHMYDENKYRYLLPNGQIHRVCGECVRQKWHAKGSPHENS